MRTFVAVCWGYGERMIKRCNVIWPAMVLIGLLCHRPLRAQDVASSVEAPLSSVPQTVPLPWWDDRLRRSFNADSQPLGLDLESTVSGVLMFSPLVRIAADVPVIRQTQIADAVARFDPRVFIDSKFTDTSDPVGNLLTTGGASRFIDQTSVSSGGVRKTFTSGGQLEAAQRIGYQNNNSNFFIPKYQGTSRITLNYTQPLLNGAGQMYNTSVIYLAELNTQAATSQLQRELQAILLDVHKAYWDLYLRRAALLQRIRLKQQAIDIQSELRARADFDVLQSQVVRADAAVATRDAAVIRFTTEVANAETRLRALINDPNLNTVPHELIPVMLPYRQLTEPNLAEALTTALQSRPEIQAGFTDVRAASVRADVSRNELLPELNLLLGTYVAGLAGNSEIAQSWVNQFGLGRPTYWTGLQFEYPLYNRSPNARRTQRLVELRQTTNKLQETMIQVRAETETAVREVVTTYREMISKYQAMKADQAEIDYLTSRWRLLAGDQQLAGVVLNDLLSAHERLADAEYDFAAAEAAYNVSLVNLNVVTGTLLRAQRVELFDSAIDGVPNIDVRSDPGSNNPAPPAQPEQIPTPAPVAVPGAAPPQPQREAPQSVMPAGASSARLMAPVHPAHPDPLAPRAPSSTTAIPIVAERDKPDIIPLPQPDGPFEPTRR